MTRKALLIGGNYREDLPGVHADISAWSEYLQSSVGGCWRPEEIDDDFTDLSRREVLAKIQGLNCVDYSVIIFSGHGSCDKDVYGFPLTRMYFDDKVTIDERELNPGNDRCLMIMDCCRTPAMPEPLMESFAEDAAITSADENIIRAAYDTAIMRCEKGITRVYAAKYDQEAADERSFSRVLISVLQAEACHATQGIITMNDAVKMAAAQMEKQQSPEYRGGRRMWHFPIAVNVPLFQNLKRLWQS